MKALVIILGMLSVVIILGLFVFSSVFEDDCQQPKKWDNSKENKRK